jgi:hypothetical protein
LSFRRSTSVSSELTVARAIAMSALSARFTASASPPSAAWIAEVKKNLSSN